MQRCTTSLVCSLAFCWQHRGCGRLHAPQAMLRTEGGECALNPKEKDG